MASTFKTLPRDNEFTDEFYRPILLLYIWRSIERGSDIRSGDHLGALPEEKCKLTSDETRV